MGAGLVTWWMDRPWWLRWIICLSVVALGYFSIWVAAAGLALCALNLLLSLREILDVVMPRKR